MPPAAISRSSTYLPKICGNMRVRKRSAALQLGRQVARFAWLGALASALSSCGDAAPRVRRIEAFTLPECAAPAADAELELFALGDFPPSNRASEVLAASSVHKSLLFSETLRAISAEAQSGGETFLGFADRSPDGVDLVLWAQGLPCAVFAPAASSHYPGALGGQALGFSAELGTVLLAGGADLENGDGQVGALEFRTHDGGVSVTDRGEPALLDPRAFATVSAFGAGLLVAGGEDPVKDDPPDQRRRWSTAQIYQPRAHRFEPERIELVEERTHHAALTLPDGEVLLIGGRGGKSG